MRQERREQTDGRWSGKGIKLEETRLKAPDPEIRDVASAATK